MPIKVRVLEKRAKDNLKSIGIDVPYSIFDTDEKEFPAGFDIITNPPFPPRLCHDTVKVGSSTYCLSHCKAISKHRTNLPDIWLVVVQVPQKDLAEHRKYLAQPSKYYYVMVGEKTRFALWNWNPGPLSQPDEVLNLLDGWNE
jgi:hypothetical protein